MFSLHLLLLFLLLNHIEIYSTDQIEDKKSDHKKLEKKIRGLFNTNKNFIPPAFRLREDELLCKCNHFATCGKVDVGSFVGDEYVDVCRPGRGGFCSRVVFLNADGSIRDVVTSCLKSEQLLPRELPFVCQNSTTPQWNKLVNCCKTESFCNDIELPVELGVRPESALSSNTTDTANGSPLVSDGFPLMLLLLLLLLFLLLLLVGVVVTILCVVTHRCPQKRAMFVDRWFGWLAQCRRHSPTLNSSKADCQMDSENGYLENGDNGSESECSSTLDRQQMGEATYSTGSGAGVAMLERRTIYHQIAIKTTIGRGRFGEVKLGEWRGEKVAVKVFKSMDGASFDRETAIYRNKMLRHPNLLRWIISDTQDTGKCIEHWLVTDYCQHGSLLGHLEKHKLSIQQCLQFIRSIAHGLDYLHTALPGMNKRLYKPAIAHRDLKPGNILIKNDWTCCIADLGMCVRENRSGEIDKPEGGDRGGTARYLAPEFLDKAYCDSSLISYLRMDIYALALVIWEVCRRVEVKNLVPASNYAVPYYEYVKQEPSPEIMRKCVCLESHRPTIPNEWSKSTVLSELTRLIRENWSEIPQSRLTALSIRCKIDKICLDNNIIISI